jgi:hypothetical protein
MAQNSFSDFLLCLYENNEEPLSCGTYMTLRGPEFVLMMAKPKVPGAVAPVQAACRDVERSMKERIAAKVFAGFIFS